MEIPGFGVHAKARGPELQPCSATIRGADSRPTLGRDGGDVSGSDVVLVATPGDAIADALAIVLEHARPLVSAPVLLAGDEAAGHVDAAAGKSLEFGGERAGGAGERAEPGACTRADVVGRSACASERVFEPLTDVARPAGLRDPGRLQSDQTPLTLVIDHLLLAAMDSTSEPLFGAGERLCCRLSV